MNITGERLSYANPQVTHEPSDIGTYTAEQIAIGTYKAHLRQPPDSDFDTVWVMVGAALARQLVTAHRLRVPFVTMELADLATWRMGEDEIAKALLADIPHVSAARRIVVVGGSGGAFAAFRVAAALARWAAPRPVRMLAFSPPSQVWPPEPRRMKNPVYRRMIELSEQSEQTKNTLEQRGDLVPMLADLPRLSPNADFRALVVASRFNSMDWSQARRLWRSPNVTVLPVTSSYHLVEYFMLLQMDGEAGTLEGVNRQWKDFWPGTDIAPKTPAQEKRLYMAARTLRDKYPSILDLLKALDAPATHAPDGKG